MLLCQIQVIKINMGLWVFIWTDSLSRVIQPGRFLVLLVLRNPKDSQMCEPNGRLHNAGHSGITPKWNLHPLQQELNHTREGHHFVLLPI